MSLLTDLFSTLERCGMSEVAGASGQWDHSISRGIEAAMGTVLGGIAGKSGTPGLVQHILDLVPAGGVEAGTADLSSAMTDPDSPLISVGRRILSMVFGGSESRIAQALGSETGLSAVTASSLLAMAAPLVASFLGKRAADEGLSTAGVASLLQREAPAIRAALPAGMSSLLGPDESEAVPTGTMATHAAEQGSWARNWILPVFLLALIPGLWLLTHGRKPAVEAPPAEIGTANRSMPDVDSTIPMLPGKLDLQFPAGSMQLHPEAEARMRDFVAALEGNPNAHISVSGYTDSTGSDGGDMRLSQERAEAVKTALIGMGLSADRITARGYGHRNPIGDDLTAGGRVANNRVTVEISDR
jgi:outer membrane protein OmpA-like peptidoglycan-associated protein